MKTKYLQKRPSFANLLCCAGAALAIAAFSPLSASAAATPGTAANAKILNIVTVTYYDATGTTSHVAATSISVTVALQQAALTVGTPSPFATVDSGSTTSSYVPLTANANGQDSYKITFSDVGTNLAASPKTVTTNIVTDITGGTSSAIVSGGTISLGATSIVSLGAPGATQVINIPGGTLNGIVVGSVVVINGTSYKVTATTAGTGAVYSQTGAQTGPGSITTPEAPGSITIAADPNGSAVAPNLTTVSAGPGTIIGERKYLLITDNASVNSNTANGTDLFSITTDTTTNSNPTVAVTDLATFYYVAVTINKTVVNLTSGAVGTAKPNDILEYTITISNLTSGNASKVVVADAVPAYTTLLSSAAGYGGAVGSGATTEKFATISDGTNLVVATLDPADSETQPGGAVLTGFGGTAGHAVTAGTLMSFYIGTGTTSNSTGGTVAASKVYTIKYQVKIN